MNYSSPDHLEFERIVAQTDQLLWQAYEASVEQIPCSTVNLRFPTYRIQTDGLRRVRVSEQEARFIMTGELAKSFLPYSVETPTSHTYRFTADEGHLEISAQTDVSVRQRDDSPLWNIEFKAHGISNKRVSKAHIEKDLKKLLWEPVDGFWFHTLESVDNGTLTLMWDVFTQLLKDGAHSLKDKAPLPDPKMFVFHVCVLRQGFSLEWRSPVDFANLPPNWPTTASPPQYEVERKKWTSLPQTTGWTVRTK